MLPTLVAPTGIMLKNPYFHLPRRATRSFKTKRLCNLLAMYGDTEKSSPGDGGQIVYRSPVTFNERTNEMSTLFNDPSGGTMESMVITRSEIDDAEVKGISGLDVSSRGASPAFHGHARPHLGSNFGGFKQLLGEILGAEYRRVGCLAKA